MSLPTTNMGRLVIVDELNAEFKSRSPMKERANLLVSRWDLNNKTKDLEMKV